MTKAKISEYDAVAANNTDVNGVNIAEGCPPSGMNNMGREIMAALKRFQVGSDGDGVTVGGNLVVSGSSTVNTFTAGPVSATTLNTSGAVVFNDAGADVDFRVEGDTDANLLFVDASADAVGIGTNALGAKLHVGSQTLGTYVPTAIFNGTSTAKFRIDDLSNVAQNRRYITNNFSRPSGTFTADDSGYGVTQIEFNDGYLTFGTAAAGAAGATERLRIDSAGNMGLGVTPSAWNSLFRSFDLYQTGSVFGRSTAVNQTGIALNAFLNSGGAWTYKNTDAASLLLQNDGAFEFRTAASGTAGNAITFTQAMTLDASGNLGIGTAAAMKLQISLGTGGTAPTTISKANSYIGLGNQEYNTNSYRLIGFGYMSTNQYPAYLGYQEISSAGATYGDLVFYTRSVTTDTAPSERMRITSGGYFKASDTGAYIGSSSGYHEFTNTVNNDALYVRASNASYTNTVLYPFATRSASSAYSIFKGGSGAGTDVEFNLRGDGNAYADGSWNGSGADYAEYFESATGEAIPRGTTVVLENNKVRAATVDDPASSIIGVVRPKEFGKGSMVVGNLAWNMWTDKYITDDFGVYEMEDHEVVEWDEQVLETEAIDAVVDEEGNEVSPAQEATYKTVPHSYESWNIPEGVTVPADATRKTHDEKGKKFQHRKLNPAWSAEVEYTPREERPEWLIIGLLGQVPVLKGQPVGDRWVKMRDISEAVEEWFIR